MAPKIPGVRGQRPHVAAGEGDNPVKLRGEAKKMELFLVFFGHTQHGGAIEIVENLRVASDPAEYGSPW